MREQLLRRHKAIHRKKTQKSKRLTGVMLSGPSECLDSSLKVVVRLSGVMEGTSKMPYCLVLAFFFWGGAPWCIWCVLALATQDGLCNPRRGRERQGKELDYARKDPRNKALQIWYQGPGSAQDPASSAQALRDPTCGLQELGSRDWSGLWTLCAELKKARRSRWFMEQLCAGFAA